MEQSVNYTSKESFQRAITTMSKMADIFKRSTGIKASGGGRNQKMVSIMYSYASILGYLYENTYAYGDYSALANQEMQIKYALTSLALSDMENRKEIIKQLANNWSDVLTTAVGVQNENSSEGLQMLNLQQDIDFVTRVVETISGEKCNDPHKGFDSIKEMELLKEKYAKMVDNSSFNPFNITTIPSLQNNPPLPDFFYETFKKDLASLFYNPAVRGMNPKDVFRGYVFNLVESYYNNAGYVPKTTVDAIINDCYKAVQQTNCCPNLGKLDDVYYWVYYSFLNK